jgi:hypothetical protein
LFDQRVDQYLSMLLGKLALIGIRTPSAMSAICAYETAGVDVKRTLQIAAADVNDRGEPDQT